VRQSSPTDPPAFGHARSLNPDAGDHVVTADAHELAAVRRAADRSWEAFPYYGARYGERGERFALSDGGWIVAVCSRPDARAQLDWLGRVLASRGMPRLLLEEHLRFIGEELRGSRYLVLRRHARALRVRREGLLAPARAREVVARFDETTAKALPRFGEILLAAVADEADGITNAVESIESWALDGERFDQRWISAVKTALRQGREIGKGAGLES
jgi:hypothetical protein